MKVHESGEYISHVVYKPDPTTQGCSDLTVGRTYRVHTTVYCKPYGAFMLYNDWDRLKRYSARHFEREENV